MRSRRTLVRVVGESSCVSAVAAAVSVQLRSHFQPSLLAQAPRRKSSVKKGKSDKLAKKAKTKEVAKSVEPAKASASLASDKGFEAAETDFSVDSVIAEKESLVGDVLDDTKTSNQGAAPESLTSGEAQTPSAAVAPDSPEEPEAAAAKTSLEDLPHSTAAEMHMAPTAEDTTANVFNSVDRAERQRAARLRLTTLQRRLLVGAHAALEGTPTCPDPRAYVPKLSMTEEERTTEAAPKSGAAAIKAQRSDRIGVRDALHSHDAIFSVTAPALLSSAAESKGAMKAGAAADHLTEPLSLSESIAIFAEVFAFTLHTVQPRWRTLAATTTAPALSFPTAQAPPLLPLDEDGVCSGAPLCTSPDVVTSQLPFLSSPYSIAAAQVLSLRSPYQSAAAMENMAPVQWLETSFTELCERAAADLHENLQELYRDFEIGSKHRSADASQEVVSEEEGREVDQHLTCVCHAVRERATSIVSALESSARSVGSRSFLAMARQWRREAAVAAAARKRKSHRPTDSVVRDTLVNTVNRVGLELHLVHVWLCRLCEQATSAGRRMPEDVPSRCTGGAVSVEAVVRQALRWSDTSAATAAAATNGETSTTAFSPSVYELQWMLATAVLEQIHAQSYHFHHARPSTVTQLKELATTASATATTAATTAKGTHVVEAQRLDGLAALVGFALAERDAGVQAMPGHTDHTASNSGGGTSTNSNSALDEGLFALLTSFYAVLPSYAVLLPAWQRACVALAASGPSPPASEQTHVHLKGGMALQGSLGERLKGEEAVEGKRKKRSSTAGSSRAADTATSQRNALLAASPAAVWDVVADRWAQQEEVIRQEGGLTAVWWLRLLPLWIHTASAVVQLRVVATVLIANATASRAVLRKKSMKSELLSDDVSEGDVHQRTADDVTASLDALLDKSGDLLRDALRFDRTRYERSLVTARAAAVAQETTQQRVGPHKDADGEDAANGPTSVSTEASATEGMLEHKRSGSEGDGIEDDEGNPQSDLDALPPLQRKRGKRSLFYKPTDQAEHTILQEVNADGAEPYHHHHHRSGSRGGQTPSRSRFTSRVRHGSGATNAHSHLSHAGSGGRNVVAAGGLAGGSTSAASADAHEKTSALFDVFVLSAETPILLTHRFGLQRDPHHRSTAVEESWAAAAHAKMELWRLLFALPSAATTTTMTTAATRSGNGTWGTAQVLRGVLPAAVQPLLPSIQYATRVARAASAQPAQEDGFAASQKRKGKRTASAGAAADAAVEGERLREESCAAAAHEELTLRRVLRVLERAQEVVGLSVIESLDHLLVAVGEVLLRIQRTGADRGATAARRRVGQHEAVRAHQQLVAVLTVGATVLVADNALLWESTTAIWQLRQLRCLGSSFPLSAAALHKSHGDSVKKFATAAAVAAPPFQPALQKTVFASAAMHAFVVQWTTTLTKELPFLLFRCRQNSKAVLANAQEMLRVLQTPSIAAGLPLYTKQVTMAALVQSLMALSGRWRQTRERSNSSNNSSLRAASAEPVDAPASHASNFVPQEDVLAVYRGVLDVLTADADLRLLCCYAAFVENLYEVHTRVGADHADLIAWADRHLLPLVLPVVVAGLRRSQSAHNAATHADLCETTLVLLSPLSRFAANPQVAMSDVLRTHWNQVLLQVSLYCIRMAGRGGAKRATDYGMPPVVLPRLTDPVPEASSSAWWSATFAHGAEPIFLRLLDQSNAVLLGAASHSIEPRDVDAADGVRDGLAAYLTAWANQVRFGHRHWDGMLEAVADDFGGEDGHEVPAAAALLRRWQAACTAVQTYTSLQQPARVAAAEAAPFIASKPVKARQLGYLVRFMEHYLREQERLSRLSDEEMQALLSNKAGEAAARGVESSSTGAATPSEDAAVASVAWEMHKGAAAASTTPLSETAPLVVLDFVGHLTSAGGWAMVTWSCNLAETVVKIELRRHRHLPEAARVVAATAILSQIRVVPPLVNSTRLPANFLKALVSLSDVVASSGESLLGFYRRSPIQGLLSQPTRDQYRALTFGLKQSTLYVQMGSRKFRAWLDVAAGTSDTAPESVFQLDGEREGADGENSPSSSPSSATDSSGMSRKVGSYYATVWAEHLRSREAAQLEREGATATTTPTTLATKDHNSEFRYYVSCLVCLFDACMESARLYLTRQQGDGEEDIRLVVEAAVVELCRTLAANLQSILSLTEEQRRTCFFREEAELLWASLCVTATISTVTPHDQKDRFFTPRCVQAIQKMIDQTQRLVDVVSSRGATPAHTEQSADAAEDEKDEVDGALSSATRASTSAPGHEAAAAAPCRRPLSAALVRGAQLLLRDPRTSIRLSLRLAMRQRDRDDLPAVLKAFHVLCTSSRLYEPGRGLMASVWARLAVELTQPLPTTSAAASAKKAAVAKRKKKDYEKESETSDLVAFSLPAEEVVLAATVPSRSEYGVVLHELSLSPAVGAAHPNSHNTGSSTSISSSPSKPTKRKVFELTTEDTASGDAAAVAALPVCDVPTALACVVEDAALLQRARQRGLQEASAALHHRGSSSSSGADADGKGGDSGFSYGLWDNPNAHLAAAAALTQPHFDVAAALESGSVPLSTILDAAIAHSLHTVRIAGGRSSFDVTADATAAAATDNDSDDPAAAVGFVRMMREHCQDLTDLLLHVPLRDIAAHPRADALFGCLHLIQGSVTPATENKLWRLLAAKWKEELLDPTESTFLTLQASQLALLRVCRGVTDSTDPSFSPVTQHNVHGTINYRSGQSARNAMQAASPDIFAPVSKSSPFKAAWSISAAAQQSMQDHYYYNESTLHHHDDGRRLLRSAAGSRKAKTDAKGSATTPADAPPSEAFPGELDSEATGLAALAAMPAPLPISVVLTILRALLRRREERVQTAATPLGSRAAAQRQAQATWEAAGGGTALTASTTAASTLKGTAAPFTVLVELVLTYVARSYWLLRPRLEDGAWLVWATMERSMAVYPAEGGVRQQEWDRLCRLWRLPSSLDHAAAARGQLFSVKERRRVAAWWAAVEKACPEALPSAPTSVQGVIAGNEEEVATYCYLRSLALYLQLLALFMNLCVRQRIFGDLAEAAPDLVRRRLVMQQQQQQQQRSAHSGATHHEERAARVASGEAVHQELMRLAQERQTQQVGVNRNLLEGAAQQYLNVAWCLTRHSDSLTHLASDVAVAAFTNTRHDDIESDDPPRLGGSSVSALTMNNAAQNVNLAAVTAFADDVRQLTAGVLQDTLDMILYDTEGLFVGRVAEQVMRSLLTSGFSSDPLYLRVPSHGSGGGGGGGGAAAVVAALQSGQAFKAHKSKTNSNGSTTSTAAAPAVSVVATLLTASSGAAVSSASGDRHQTLQNSSGDAIHQTAQAAAQSRGGSASSTGLSSRIARAELFVGSPTWLAVMTPHFIQKTVMTALHGACTPAALLPVTSALEFYLSRRNVPLSPLLEATTELLTSCQLRSSAVHTYCERLASELTTRKEFRQALAPPAIASVEQGPAGSVSNEVVIAFLAAIARQDVHVTKKTLAHLLHSVMSMRLDIFGQPPTANRQGKLTLVQVGTTVEATIDTTNPLYTPKAPQTQSQKPERSTRKGQRAADANSTTQSARRAADEDEDGSGDDDDVSDVMRAFSADKWSDFTAMTHRKALAALTLSLPSVMEVAMHMEAMRPLDYGERRRATQMLKAADDARRERVAMHRSQAQVAASATAAAHSQRVRDKNTTGSSTATSPAPQPQQAVVMAAAVGKLDASLHLEDPLDFGVAMLHLRYALRKIVHASLRRLLHQQGPRMLAEVATMLECVDPAMQAAAEEHSHGGGGGSTGHGAAAASTRAGFAGHNGGGGGGRAKPYDGVLAGTLRVLLSRAVLCAQGIGYDANGSALELPPLQHHSNSSAVAAEAVGSMEPQPVLKLPVPALQASAVDAAISALATTKGRHPTVGHSSGKVGQLTKAEKAAVHQRVELEREAAVTVGLTTQNVPRRGQQRILRAMRFTRRQLFVQQQRREFGRRRAGDRPTSSFGSGSRTAFTSSPAKRPRLSMR